MPHEPEEAKLPSLSAWRKPGSAAEIAAKQRSSCEMTAGVHSWFRMRLILHSVADYPLRTVTLTVVFALCCGLLELARRTEQTG